MSSKPFCDRIRVVIDPRNGDMLVADGCGEAQVCRFTPDDKRLLKSWGESCIGLGQFGIFHDIAVDRDGWVYIANDENQRIQVFDPNGRFEPRRGD